MKLSYEIGRSIIDSIEDSKSDVSCFINDPFSGNCQTEDGILLLEESGAVRALHTPYGVVSVVYETDPHYDYDPSFKKIKELAELRFSHFHYRNDLGAIIRGNVWHVGKWQHLRLFDAHYRSGNYYPFHEANLVWSKIVAQCTSADRAIDAEENWDDSARSTKDCPVPSKSANKRICDLVV